MFAEPASCSDRVGEELDLAGALRFGAVVGLERVVAASEYRDGQASEVFACQGVSRAEQQTGVRLELPSAGLMPLASTR